MGAQDPRIVQARLTLVMYLYKEALRGVTQALEIVKAPALRADEKEAIFGEVERAAWDLPDAFFVNPPDTEAGWEDRAGDEPKVREALERGVRRVLVARREGAPPI